ncbi:hypothetical protein MCAMS1_02817 [biofilm metagenome]
MTTKFRICGGDYKTADTESIIFIGEGDITVQSGGNLTAKGFVNGDITVENDASLDFTGIITGDIYNYGGKASIKGELNGEIKANSGETAYTKKTSDTFTIDNEGGARINFIKNQTNVRYKQITQEKAVYKNKDVEINIIGTQINIKQKRRT